MIIEGLLTTADSNGYPHVAPMGPVVDEHLQSWQLRPFQTSQTFANLRRRPDCVFHVVDDVLAVVQAVLHLPLELPFRSLAEGAWLIESSCHWYHLRVTQWNTTDLRSEAMATVTQSGFLRPFWGWNRAKHAILEATILVTRLHLLDPKEVAEEFKRLENAVNKTAGSREQEAWKLLRKAVAEKFDTPNQAQPK